MPAKILLEMADNMSVWSSRTFVSEAEKKFQGNHEEENFKLTSRRGANDNTAADSSTQERTLRDEKE